MTILTADEQMVTSEFLAHHGIKGMKWGVRKATDSVGSGAKTAAKASAIGSEELRRRAALAGQVAFTAAKVGAPTVLSLSGVGLPVVASVGLSMKLVSDPDVQKAIVSSGQYVQSMLKDIGNTTRDKMEISLHGKDYHNTMNTARKMDLPKKRDPDKPFFNPKAKIDTSQIEVRGRPGSYEDINNMPYGK